MRRRVLFVCTGNYYRSRFAELLFNHLACEAELNWQADSRGFHAAEQPWILAPILPDVQEALVALGVRIDRQLRFPLQLQLRDLKRADLVIALDEAEHRADLAKAFPGWEERVDYWHVQDLHAIPASLALPAIEQEVRALIQRLQTAFV
jgi:protein-tyrosine phosphatase